MSARKPNTTSKGGSFDAATIQAVWEKGTTVPGSDSKTWRKDTCGALMKRGDHGDTNSKYGWEIDHRNPVANGGADNEANLQPLQWENNRHKSDDYPTWYCKVKA